MISTNKYVYIVNSTNKINCYKVGSTKDPMIRIYQLNTANKDYFKPILIGKPNTKSAKSLEEIIQFSIRKFSNQYNTLYGNEPFKPDAMIGSKLSKEHFILDTEGLNTASKTMATHCCELYGKNYRKLKDDDIKKLLTEGGEA